MWTGLFDDEFATEFAALDERTRAVILKYAGLLASKGPDLGRPYCDTLKGSAFARMKELRPTVNKVEWRVAFAFDPRRTAILLTAAAEGGRKDAVVYDRLIRTADARFAAHLERLKEQET